jgi:hypothetical protein
MKAAQVSWAVFAVLLGNLMVAIGHAFQGHPDWAEVTPAIAGMMAVFLPAAQLALTKWFKPAPHQGDMPVVKS